MPPDVRSPSHGRSVDTVEHRHDGSRVDPWDGVGNQKRATAAQPGGGWRRDDDAERRKGISLSGCSPWAFVKQNTTKTRPQAGRGGSTL